MKVRIGFGTGGAALDAAGLAGLADDLVELGFDSLWLSEVLTQAGIDPLIGLAWAAAHNERVKLGTTMLLPGRNLVRLAKQTAVLDHLSAGRLLLTFVPGLARGPERAAVGVPPKARGALIEEALPVLRQLWDGQTVSYHGAAGDFDDVAISPLPSQRPLEAWLGGSERPALVRCGTYGDGWLPAICTPEEVVAGRAVIDEAAEAAGRAISPEHFGVSIGYSWEPLPDAVRAAFEVRAKGRPIESLIPVGLPALREQLEAFIDVGFSKFVVRPHGAPGNWRAELERLADGVLDLQT